MSPRDAGPVHIWPITCFNWQSLWYDQRRDCDHTDQNWNMNCGRDDLHRSLSLPLTKTKRQILSHSIQPSCIHAVAANGEDDSNWISQNFTKLYGVTFEQRSWAFFLVFWGWTTIRAILIFLDCILVNFLSTEIVSNAVSNGKT